MTLLAVLAHPDDETFGMGGTLALYAQLGVSVHLICATRGEVGDVEPHYLEGYQSIGELREDDEERSTEVIIERVRRGKLFERVGEGDEHLVGAVVRN